MTHLLHNILLTTPFNFYNLLHYNYSLLKVVEPQLLQQLLIEFLRVQLPVKFKDVHTDHVNILFCRHLFSLLHFFHFPTFPMDLFVFYYYYFFIHKYNHLCFLHWIILSFFITSFRNNLFQTSCNDNFPVYS